MGSQKQDMQIEAGLMLSNHIHKKKANVEIRRARKGLASEPNRKKRGKEEHEVHKGMQAALNMLWLQA
jgi:hypothetical protein